MVSDSFRVTLTVWFSDEFQFLMEDSECIGTKINALRKIAYRRLTGLERAVL